MNENIDLRRVCEGFDPDVCVADTFILVFFFATESKFSASRMSGVSKIYAREILDRYVYKKVR